MSFTLEVIAFTIDSCIIIEQSGAHRIELCANPEEGGTTPSYGMIKAAREKVAIDLFPIIRPRGGDFLYNEDEYQIMVQDVRLCKELGCNGVVIGLLQHDGTIDKERTKRLVEIAYPLDITFHRAFDRVKDPMQSLEDVIECGCTRILTSGLHPTAMAGKEVIRQLVEAAKNRVVIMPGSGVRAATINELRNDTGAEEFHTSARILRQSTMSYQAPQMNEDLSHFFVDEDEVKNIIRELNLSNKGS